jgi:hypothetical protein
MHEHKFERSVQEKMEGLRLEPSAPVWLEVEAEIRKDRRKRRIIFWILPLALVLAGGSAWLLAGSKNKGTNPIGQAQVNPGFSPASPAPTKTVEIQSGKTRQPEVELTSAPPLPTPAPAAPTNLSDADANTSSAKKTATTNPSNTTSSKNIIEINGKKQGSKTVADLARHTAPSKKNKNVIKQLSPGIPDAISNTEPGKALTKETAIAAPPIIAAPKDSVKKSSSPPIASLSTDSSLQAPPATKKPSPKKHTRWQWTVAANGGIARISTASLPTTGATSSPVAPGVSSITTYDATKAKPGTGFSVEVLAGRPIARGLVWQVGLGYTQIHTSQEQTGTTYFNTAATGGLSGTPPSSIKTVTNATYHYITLPVKLQWKPLAGIPITFSPGISVQQLVAASGSYFDSGGSLHSGKDGIRKTSLSFDFGASYRIWHKKSLRLDAGPQLQYGPGSFYQNNPAHLLRFGLGLQFSF